jgi:hypothetical protein
MLSSLEIVASPCPLFATTQKNERAAPALVFVSGAVSNQKKTPSVALAIFGELKHQVLHTGED